MILRPDGPTDLRRVLRSRRRHGVAARRPDWLEYFITMARLAARRSSCPRRRVGAVLVRDNRVIATGYNGAVRGAPHCTEAGCLIVDGHCVRAVHAELNAILQCAVTGTSSVGCTLFTTSFPCVGCAKAIVQAGVSRVIYLRPYPDPNSEHVLRAGGVCLARAEPLPSGGYRLRTEV
jgi:dCMP deaminase